MFLRKPVKYAIRAIIFMATEDESKVYTAANLSENLELPKEYISKIMQKLSKSNIVLSRKGKGGGFFLSESYKSKRLIDIIVAIDGKIDFNICFMGFVKCDCLNKCPVHKSYENLQNDIKDLFLNNSIDQILTLKWFT